MIALRDYLNQQIQAHQGQLAFVDFMRICLYSPLGYYCNKSAKFGKAGDFITAPELSPLFAQTLAQTVKQVLQQLDTGVIIEYGGGSGQLAYDLLIACQQLDCLPQQYYLLDISPELQQRQQHLLAQLPAELFSLCQWVAAIPQPVSGVILANEVLDAMPVELFCYQAKQYWRGYVKQQGDDYQLIFLPWPDDVPFVPREFAQALSAGYVSEFNPQLGNWFARISAALTQGLVLVIDYGFDQTAYYHPDRTQGTLMCHFQHQAHPNPLVHIGQQDITAHVDFTAVAKAAIAAGLQVSGFTSQSAFLLNCGILSHYNALLTTLAQQQALRLLLSPEEMGELFKVMALTKQLDLPLDGFAQFDRYHTLGLS